MKTLHRKQQKLAKGFTIAELLIVVAIIAILVAVAIPVFAAATDKAKEATCAANRRSAYGQISYGLMDNPSYDVQAVIDQYQHTCPGDGIYYAKEVDGRMWVFCTTHEGDIVEGLLHDYTYLCNNLATNKDYEKFAKEKGWSNPKWVNNDRLRQYVYETNGGWPTLELEGETYFVQPYINKASGAEWEQPIIFANTNGTIDKGSWYTSLIYWEGVWYHGGKSAFSVTQATPETVWEEMQKRGWQPLDSNEYQVLPQK